MPRASRGGAARTAYPNRTDLNLPKTTVPNQEYGKATQQRAAQDIVPMGQSPVAPVAPGAPMGQNPLAQQPVVPGSLPFLDATQRPNEPIQAGIPSGPGPGPEAILPPPSNLISDSLRLLASGPHATSASYDLLHAAQEMGI